MRGPPHEKQTQSKVTKQTFTKQKRLYKKNKKAYTSKPTTAPITQP